MAKRTRRKSIKRRSTKRRPTKIRIFRKRSKKTRRRSRERNGRKMKGGTLAEIAGPWTQGFKDGLRNIHNWFETTEDDDALQGLEERRQALARAYPEIWTIWTRAVNAGLPGIDE